VKLDVVDILRLLREGAAEQLAVERANALLVFVTRDHLGMIAD
jgi:hypothetical protein